MTVGKRWVLARVVGGQKGKMWAATHFSEIIEGPGGKRA